MTKRTAKQYEWSEKTPKCLLCGQRDPFMKKSEPAYHMVVIRHILKRNVASEEMYYDVIDKKYDNCITIMSRTTGKKVMIKQSAE